jgi:CHAT domain-containing protein
LHVAGDIAVRFKRWASLVVVILVAGTTRGPQMPPDELAVLVDAGPGAARVIEPRVSGGFSWAPFVPRSGSGIDATSPTLTRAALHVIHATGNVPSGEARLAASAAYLLIGNAEAAVASLTPIAEDHRDPAIWNNLAAAHYVLAAETDSIEHLEAALVAADQALRFDDRNSGALFNRALILERYHLRDAAISAWRHYLTIDAESEWAAEARSRLDTLSRPRPTFSTEIELSYARLERGDRHAADDLVRFDAGEARSFGEMDALGRWGDACLRGDAASAARHLIAAHTLGDALRTLRGEVLLADSVAAIERASPSDVERLARGHVAYREGRHVYRQLRKPTESEKILSAATLDFDTARSPMVWSARVYTGIAIFGQGRTDEAKTLFTRLNSSIPQSYGALRAYARWQTATCFMSRSEWGEVIALLSGCIDDFDRLGESGNVAYLHDILGQVYGIIGDRDRAAHHRLLALGVLGQSTNYRLEHAVSGMVYDAMQSKKWRSAMSFLNIEAEMARRVKDPELQGFALLRRALLHSRLGDGEEAAADVVEANGVVASIQDPALRNKLEAERMATAALVATGPQHAISLLTAALQFQETKGWRLLMPDLFLRRGRMYLQIGDRAAARRDFESGIEELEKHRGSIPAGEQRWGSLDAASELFEEAIDDALRDSPARAFAWAERQRARSLSDNTSDAGAAFDAATLPADSALVEYVTLPHKLLIFHLDRHSCRVEEKNVGREEVLAIIDRFSEALRGAPGRQPDAYTQAASSLLVAPADESITAVRQVIFVPDPLMSAVPFAALTDGVTESRLLDNHTVVVAPSARFFQQASKRVTTNPRRRVLIVENPQNETIEPLAEASEEGKAVALEYTDARRLSGTDATLPAIAENAGQWDVIHFAAHGRSSSESAVLMLAPAKGSSGVVDASTLARLRLSDHAIVVLATCGSARGPVRRSEGTLSIAHAFLQAGAAAVISTLWPISDSDAAVFFPRLHRDLARGVPPAEALRIAQLECIRTSTENRTTFWAAMQAIGD